MSGKGVCCRSRTGLVKVPVSLPTVAVFVALLSSLFHGEQTSAAGFPAPRFAATRAFDAGAGPRAVTPGDFNGDGKPDLAVANSTGIAVLLGEGDGAFQTAINTGAGPSPESLAVGDFNGDGTLDMAVANFGEWVNGAQTYTNSSVSVLLGKGGGTFQTAVNYDAGGRSRFVAVGDFNGDGKPDLAVVNSIGDNGAAFPASNVAVLLGKGDGSFHAAVNYDAGANPSSAVVGDFNGDGKSDLAVANMRGVSVLLGNGDGTFQAAVSYSEGQGPHFIAVGDFNGDGTPDLAVAGWATSYWSVAVLLGNGDGTFQPPLKHEAGVSGPVGPVAVGDFNGDGKLDLAVANNGSFPETTVAVLLGNGDGTLQNAISYVAGWIPQSLAVGDFNADGKPDLAVATFENGVSVLFGNGDGNFQAVNHFAGRGTYVTAGDFNGDGKADLLEANGGTVSVLLGKGDGTFQAGLMYSDYTAELHPASVAVSDFNGDGKPDLAVANQSSSWMGPYPDTIALSILLGNGDGTFRPAIKYDAGTEGLSLSVGDFNGDGKADIAIVESEAEASGIHSTNIWVRLGNGDGTLQAAVSYGVGSDPNSVVAGDFNGDGKLDLAVAHSGSYDQSSGTYADRGVSILLGHGDGTFQRAVRYNSGARLVAVGDFNKDGNLDLAVANEYSRDVSVLLGRGDGTFRAAVNSFAGAYPVSVAVGDFNADGNLDMAVLDYNVSVLLGRGDGSFQTAASYVAGVFPTSLAVADFDGDGRPDIALSSVAGLDPPYGAMPVEVLLNTTVSTGIGLSINRGVSNITLSWPLPHADFVLESTTSLTSTNWQRVLESPKTNSGRWELTAPFDQQGRFFRLRKP